MKQFLSLLLMFVMCFSVSAQKAHIDLTKYDAANSSNVTVTDNGNGSVTLSLTDPEQAGYVLFSDMTDFTGYEKFFFAVQHSAVPSAGQFTYTLVNSAGTTLYDNSAGGKYQPYSSQSATAASLDFAAIATNGGDISDCYFAVKIAPTTLTSTLSNAYAYIAPVLPTGTTDLQTIPYTTFAVSGTTYTISSAPKTISVPSFSNWSSGNQDIIGDFNNWNVIPGKYWDLSNYSEMQIQLTAPAEMAGKKFQIRLGNIPPVIPEDPANYGGTYTANSKYVDVTLTGGTQTVLIDLTAADMTKYISIIRFMNPDANANISLDVDYIVVSETLTNINTPAIDNAIVDVYDLSGLLIRKAVKSSEATVGLKKGFYIVGKNKVIVK